MNYKQTTKSAVPNSGSFKNIINLRRLITVTYLMVVILTIINLIGTNSLATQGMRLDQIQLETDTLSRDNQETAIQISQIVNLSKAREIAKSSGYRPVGQVYYVSGGAVVASLPLTTHE